MVSILFYNRSVREQSILVTDRYESKKQLLKCIILK